MTDQERFTALIALKDHVRACDLHGDCDICRAYYRILLTKTPSGGKD